MGLLSRLYDFLAGNTIVADEVDAEFDQILAEMNGNLDNSNIKASAGIDGSKLANTSIPTTKYVAKSVTDTVLANDAAVDANRAVGSDHIKDDAVISRHIKDDAVTDANRPILKDMVRNSQFGLDKLQYIVKTVAADVAIPAVGHYRTSPTWTDMPLVADYECVGAYAKNGSQAGAGSSVFMVNIEPIDSGANWDGKLNVYSVASGNVTCTCVMVFVKKVS